MNGYVDISIYAYKLQQIYCTLGKETLNNVNDNSCVGTENIWKTTVPFSQIGNKPKIVLKLLKIFQTHLCTKLNYFNILYFDSVFPTSNFSRILPHLLIHPILCFLPQKEKQED